MKSTNKEISDERSEESAQSGPRQRSQEIRKEIMSVFKDMISLYEQQYKKNVAPIGIYSVLKEKILETAKQHDLPASELVETLLQEGLERFEKEAAEEEDELDI
jgi:hypothetical protein